MTNNEKERPCNLVKEIAIDLLPSVIQRLEIEDTAENREDILALALNKLPTKYITSCCGKMYAQMIDNYRVQYETDVLSSLTRAGMTVKNKPRRGTISSERAEDKQG